MKRIHESGSVLVFILIAVALFGALSYTVAQMMRGGNAEAISEQQASILADEILGTARQIRQASQAIRISNGCEDTDISFENPSVGGYTHSPVAQDACKIYNSAGGGLSYIVPPSDWLDQTLSSTPALYGEWFFPEGVCVSNIGTGGSCPDSDNFDIIAVLPYVERQICIQINEKLGVDNPGGNPPQETGDAWRTSNDKFQGVYSGSGKLLQQSNQMNGCFEGDSSSTPPAGTYHFFQVILPR